MAIRQSAEQRAPARRRAIGIVRVSHVGKKRKAAGARFVSPREQQDRIRAWCIAQHIELVDTYEELDVSGGLPLDRRPGLLPAIERIENGEAQVLVAAYFDRVVRSLQVQAEVLERVEGAGGSVVALDVGEVSTANSVSWLNSTVHGMMSEYLRRQAREKTAEAQDDAVGRGVPPYPRIPFGYRRGKDGRLVVVPSEAELVRNAFEQRAAGASVGTLYAYLRERGFSGSFHAVQTLLATRLVLGEVHFGQLVNTEAHEPIVDRVLWQRVQKVIVPRGRRSISTRLLARLGVLRCATCTSKLTVAYFKNARQEIVWAYRCSRPGSTCAHPVLMSADIIEPLVVAEVKRLLADESETTSAATDIAEAEVALERAQAMLDAAVEAFDGLNAASAQRKLQVLQQQADDASERLDRLRATSSPSRTISASGDWEVLSHEAQRALITAVLREVRIKPGRGAKRVEFIPK
jgi:DNA invertase Pin-like site-specific DNA recombinase